MKDLILLLVGAVLGAVASIFLGECYKWSGLDKRSSKWIRRLRVSPIPKNRRESTFMLGSKDCHTCIIDGDGSISFSPNEIVVRQDRTELPIPPDLLASVEEIKEREKAKEERGEQHAWNGRMTHMIRFTPSRKSDSEEGLLSLSACIAQYYHYMATSVLVYEDFQKHGFASSARKKYLGDFSNWRTKPVPNIINGLPVNLVVFTSDDMIVLGKRSYAVAIGPGEVSCAINENFHPDHDKIGEGDRLSTEVLIKRALREEIGWSDQPDTIGVAEVNILGFGVHTGSGAYGLFGYATLPITFPELQLNFAMRARDRHETEHLIALPFDLKRIAGFMHYQNLYNFVGMCIAMSLHHKAAISLNSLDAALREVQSASGAA